MPLWLLVTLLAAFGQNVRSSFQKYLKGAMGTGAVTFVRFGFGWPFVLLYLAIIVYGLGGVPPAPNAVFGAWLVVGSLAQIGAQALLIALFSLRNFAAGSAYARVEPVQAAIIGIVFLGDTISPVAWLGIAIGVAGVLALSATDDLRPSALVRALVTRAALMGLACATLFGLSAVAYRAAGLALSVPQTALEAFTNASVVNSAAIVFQTIVLGAWLTWRTPHEWRAMARAWKPSLLVGFVGATVTLLWFVAFVLQPAAIVKAVAQVELLLAVATSAIVFRERIAPTELIGCALVALGVAVLLSG